MEPRVSHSDAVLRGLAVALLAFALVAAVSPVYVMPGCEMGTGQLLDMDCQHGTIIQHIQASSAPAAVVVAVVLLAVAAIVFIGVRIVGAFMVPIPASSPLDPLGVRLRL